MDRVATSFYVSNLPDLLDAKGLWKACMPYKRLADTFIAKKLSKRDKRFGFIRFLGVTDASVFIRSPSNIWIGNFHIYVSLDHFQRSSNLGNQSNNKIPPKEHNTNQNTKPYPNQNINPKPSFKPLPIKSSFASVLHNKPNLAGNAPPHKNTRSIKLNDQDLIRVEDSTSVILLKVKDMDSMSNMYMICMNEGFLDLKIHHVGGFWIWIQFPSSVSCAKFRENITMKSLYSAINSVSPSFIVDERMIWIEISGLPLCAWGSNAFKKVAGTLGKFMFSESEESTAMSSGRVCISTRSHNFVSKKVLVEIHEEMFEAQVHELGNWSINISDDSLDTSSRIDLNDIDKVEDSIEENSLDDLNDLNDNLNDEAHDNQEDDVHMDKLKDTYTDQKYEYMENKENNEPNVPRVSESSDLSYPLGFEFMKRSSSNTSKCSTSFARRHKKDLK
ncbi:RNA-directed DNA polymerase, eukaryota [Tanacetum coccineum]